MTATAPAQEVFITDTLQAELDPTTVIFQSVSWGAETIPVTQIGDRFHVRHIVNDYRDDEAKLWWVDIDGHVDRATGLLTWTFRTLDPETGDLPLDALAGFLPPNDETDRGQGYVSFSVEQDADLPLGTTISNFAEIVFDTNEPIITNSFVNQIGEPVWRIYLPVGCASLISHS